MESSPSSSTSNRNRGREERNAVTEAKLRKELQSNTHWVASKGRYHERLMTGLRLIRYDGGDEIIGAAPSMILSFDVTKDLCNDFDTLHGGAQATAIDLYTSILCHHVHPIPSVTADLHVSCVSAAPIGSTIICVCKAEKYSGSLQYSSCDLYREVADRNATTEGNPPTQTRRVLVAKGLHTKYVLKKRAKGYGGEKLRSRL